MAEEYTKGGQPIIRGKVDEDRGWTPPEVNGEIRSVVERHLAQFLPARSTVWHEIISDLVHIDVYCFVPTPERAFYTLVTSGMSDLPMNVPEGLEDMARAELLICLPPDWKIGQLGDTLAQDDLEDFSNYWPIHMLKYLARMPHEYHTWLGWGHSIPNGQSPEPFANTSFVGTVIGPVVTLPDEFVSVQVDDQTVWFYGLYPVYAEEMQFKIDTPEGADALFEKFESAGVTELIDLQRPNVMTSRFSSQA